MPATAAGVGVITAGVAVGASSIPVATMAHRARYQVEKDFEKYRGLKQNSKLANLIRNVGKDILDKMEAVGGHTLSRHVSKTNQELINRAITEEVEAATNFTDKNTAIKALQENLRKNANDIAEWLETPNSRGKVTFERLHSHPIGKGVLADKKTVTYDLVNSKIVLVKDATQELGFKILTAFPVIK